MVIKHNICFKHISRTMNLVHKYVYNHLQPPGVTEHKLDHYNHKICHSGGEPHPFKTLGQKGRDQKFSKDKYTMDSFKRAN